MLLIFKSAVAFFFLFFLHGTSIGNGQQGISYNGLGLCAVWDFKAQKFSLAQKFNRNPNVQFSTSAQIAQNPCYGQLLLGFSN